MSIAFVILIDADGYINQLSDGQEIKHYFYGCHQVGH